MSWKTIYVCAALVLAGCPAETAEPQKGYAGANAMSASGGASGDFANPMAAGVGAIAGMMVPPSAGMNAPAQDASVSMDAGVVANDAAVMMDAMVMIDSGPSDSGMMMDAAPPTGDGGMSVSGIPEAELAMLRQVCVDEINMYRATLSLDPIARGSADQELCSDRGAKKDGDSGDAHSSSGSGNPCSTGGFGSFPGFSGQNTCPGYSVGGFGAATIADALKGCLEQMWAEGEPPEGSEECERKYFMGDTACFLAHGHYLNMKRDSEGVSCGFYKMMNGKYWMNQDFF